MTKPLEILKLIKETDKLKSVYRRAYLSQEPRNENSAEHSWHLCIVLMALEPVMPNEINLDHSIRMALIHDICEIGAGDISIYSKKRDDKFALESKYIEYFKSNYGYVGHEVQQLWLEYEKQSTQESKWVRVVDRLLPFLMNVITEGKTWLEQDVCKSQVINVNKSIQIMYPELYKWMLDQIDAAVKKGWLRSD